jgi:peptide deformylase
MAIRRILTYPDEVLTEAAAAVESFGPELQQLIDDMFETMYAAPGVGLAAPQVGVSRRIMVIDLSTMTDPAQCLTLINPELVSSEGASYIEEGCLSLPGISVKVSRPRKLTIQGLDRAGRPIRVEGEDLLARALHHEIDHINGTLILDRLHPVKRGMVKKKIKKTLESPHSASR